MTGTPGSAEQFPNPPVQEAIFTIGYDPPINDLEEVGNVFHAAVRDEYPDRRLVVATSYDLQIEGAESGSVAASRDLAGLQFRSANGVRVVQISRNAFTHNRLPPYPGWEVFFGEAERVWEQFHAIHRLKLVTSVGVRYTNRIALPGPTGEIGSYFRTFPEMAPSLESAASYFLRVVIPDPVTGATGVLTQAIEPFSYKPGGEAAPIPVLFDIDVSLGRHFIADAGKIRHVAQALRGFRNQLFFDSITERTRELFR